MLGIIVLLLASYLLVWFTYRINIFQKWLKPTQTRTRQFLIGFIFAGVICALSQSLELFLSNASLQRANQDIVPLLFDGLFWDLKSVLSEELVFRGALLLILIKKMGNKYAVLVSALAFGVYHWFSFGILGNLVPMFFVLISTGLMGLAWAMAYAKTNSLALAFGLHLGWNFVFNTIFSNGPLGALVFVQVGGQVLRDGAWIINFICESILVPMIFLLFVKYFVPNAQEP